MASLLEAITTTAKAVSDTIKKKKEENKETSGGSSTGATQTASEAAASGNFETPFNGKHRTSGGTGTSMSDYGIGGTTGSSNYGYGTYTEDLNKLTKAQRQAQVDELKAARTKALANLDAQEQNIKPYYQTARNQTSAASQQGARNFAEYLANRGLTNSGAAAQGEINRQSALINNLGNINTAEANAYRDIANQRAAIENNYVSSLANANNALTNNYYNNLLNYNEQQRQYINNLQQQALGQYAGDYQAYMNTLDPNSLEYLQAAAARGNKVASANNNAYTYNNAINNIRSGNWNYNDLVAAGMTNEQAQKLYTDTVAATEAQNAATAEQLAYDRGQQALKNQIDLQKLANATAETQYAINKPYNSTVYHVSNNNDNANTPKQLTLKDTQSILKDMTPAERQRTIDYWYNTNQISDELFDYYQV